ALERLERGGCVLDGAHGVAGCLEQLDEREADGGFVVDDEDVHGDDAPAGCAAPVRPLDGARDASPGSAARASGTRDVAAAGSRILNSAPPPGASSTSSSQSSSRAMRRTTLRPSPVPSTLAVWNGSKMRERSAAGTPGPVSRTEMVTRSPALALSVTTPPRGVCASALRGRLSSACASASRGAGAGRKSVV